MIVYIGADHRGVELKKKVKEILLKLKYSVVDVGVLDEESCDYPKLSLKVALEVVAHPGSLGILICMTGIGHSIAANKIPGINAALCYNQEAAILSRQHNDANILVLGAKFLEESQMFKMIEAWLTTSFEGGRHLRRVNQIREIEKKYLKDH